MLETPVFGFWGAVWQRGCIYAACRRRVRNPPVMCRQGLSPKPITNETNRSMYVESETESNPLDGFSDASDADVVTRGTAVVTNMTGNPNSPNPPVEPLRSEGSGTSYNGFSENFLVGRTGGFLGDGTECSPASGPGARRPAGALLPGHPS